MRAIPNLQVFRPADVIETAECWELALRDGAAPSILALTRQGLAPARLAHSEENLCARGGYILNDAPDPQATLFASGSEVELALRAQASLACDAVRVRVVSVPCMERFKAQDKNYRDSVLGTGPRIAIEAAIRQGWDAILRPEDDFIGMDGFGASAPAPELFEKFGITEAAIVAAVRSRLD